MDILNLCDTLKILKCHGIVIEEQLTRLTSVVFNKLPIILSVINCLLKVQYVIAYLVFSVKYNIESGWPSYLMNFIDVNLTYKAECDALYQSLFHFIVTILNCCFASVRVVQNLDLNHIYGNPSAYLWGRDCSFYSFVQVPAQ